MDAVTPAAAGLRRITRTGVAGTPTFLLLAADMPRAGAAQPADLTTYC